MEDAGFFDGLPDERSSASPDSESTEAAEEALITQKLAHLPQVQQEAIRLRVFDELSYAEIAQRLNRREPAIRQLVSRGLKRLRAQWGSFG